MTVQCCKCKRCREDDDWSAPAETLLHDGVSHTYCPTCADTSFIELFSDQASRVTAREAVFLRDYLDVIDLSA